MKKRGLASLTIATTAFEVLARTQAKALGEPALPVAIIAHPLGPRSRADLRELVDRHLAGIVALVSDEGAPQS